MIILSICIPTYNRCEYLRDTIESIISQSEFIKTDEVEIVVSDNCSSDNTEDVMIKYVNRYPGKIKYNKNAENIFDFNYEKVLSIGAGEILKLHNDTLILNPGAIKFMLGVCKYCINNKLIPFFLNGYQKKLIHAVCCESVEKFISTVSYWCTWIGGFSISKNEFLKISDFSKKAPLMLTQVYVLMYLLSKGNKILIVPENIAKAIPPAKKGGYNLPQIFLTNYFQILRPFFITKSNLEIFEKERKRILFKFILPWIVKLKIDIKNNSQAYTFIITNYNKIIKKEFSLTIYYLFKIKLIAHTLFWYIKNKILTTIRWQKK